MARRTNLHAAFQNKFEPPRHMLTLVNSPLSFFFHLLQDHLLLLGPLRFFLANVRTCTKEATGEQLGVSAEHQHPSKLHVVLMSESGKTFLGEEDCSVDRSALTSPRTRHITSSLGEQSHGGASFPAPYFEVRINWRASHRCCCSERLLTSHR